ncbi:molybdopterin-guanine dinucleotide biosynthesis protein B [Mergibacter septicus]|uniref:molybdopterin-guanine dinucleotide biosynthesis protein B n=1 Tax=Mergibacter septicus TaxID=221402 RepID=UPI00224029C8|nr:molybdopterin-guanine dinucleotide biosynthesis protein B [Mergibacter septicus]
MTRIPMLGITGYSGSGKTTLLEQLVPTLSQQGINVAVIKHTHHNVETDKKGKDSWRMTQAGAKQVIMTCNQRWALMTETTKPADFNYLVAQFDPNLVDLILVEGFKHEPIPKILLHRQSVDKPLPEIDQWVMAIASDQPELFDIYPQPVFQLNQIEAISEFIQQHLLKQSIK